MVCGKMEDKEGIMKYSLMGMPNLSAPMRNARKEWVTNNVQLAEKNLRRLEELNMEAYGEPDDNVVDYDVDGSSDRSLAAKSDQIEDEIGDDSAWQ